jgi:hypothetical protein
MFTRSGESFAKGEDFRRRRVTAFLQVEAPAGLPRGAQACECLGDALLVE